MIAIIRTPSMNGFMRLVTVSACIVVAAACRQPPAEPTPRPSPRVLAVPAATQQDFISALRLVLADVPAATVVCLEVQWGPPYESFDPTSDFLDAIRVLRQVVPRSICPTTYATMIFEVDRQGRPVPSRRPDGYVDPYHVQLFPSEVDSLAAGVVRVDLWQGTGGTRYRCTKTANGWQCRQGARMLS